MNVEAVGSAAASACGAGASAWTLHAVKMETMRAQMERQVSELQTEMRASNQLVLSKLSAAQIHPDIFGSDHCPVSAVFDL